MKEIPNKATGNSYTAVEFTEGVKTELQSVVSSTNQAFNAVDQTQLLQGLTRIAGGAGFYTDTGGVNAYALSFANPFTGMQLTEYYSGLVVTFIGTITNTGASTASVAGLAATNIEDGFGNDLGGGEIQTNQVTTLVFESGAPDKWIFLRPSGTPRVQVRWDSAGVIIGKSIGVASIAHPDTGLYTITFITPFTNASYFTSLTTFDSPSPNPQNVAVVDFALATTSSIRVSGLDTQTGVLTNITSMSLQIWANP